MNRGRFIGLASLPVWFLGAPTIASEVEATRPETAAPAAPDAAWAERWKAAAAEAAARRVAEQAEWAVRWKAAADALRSAQTRDEAAVPPADASPARKQAPKKSPSPIQPAGNPGAIHVASGTLTPASATDSFSLTPPIPSPAAMQRVQWLSMAPRRPKVAQPDIAEPPAGGTPAPENADSTEKMPAPDAAMTPVATAPASTAPAGPDDELVPLHELQPFGYADSPFERSRNEETDYGGRNRRMSQGDFLPVPDRFRIGLPGNYVQNVRGRAIDPYNLNIFKGDYPIIDKPGNEDDIFMVATFTSDTLFEARRLPVPTPVSANDRGQFGFFDDAGRQQIVNQNLIASFELFAGDTSYRPRDFEIRATVVGNFNYVHAEQQQVVNVDFREGSDRFDQEFGVQELFYEKHLHDLSNSYDVIALRAGIQGFNSDFRGFLFSDNLPGVRLFGNYDDNRWQYNLAYFRQVEKDTNSGLNTFDDRNQNIFVANVYRQDFLVPGYTASLSLTYNNDHSAGDEVYDRNGFLVRPSPVGTIGTDEVDVVYLGWGGDGHIGKLNLTHQVYEALGRESFNPIAGREADINAQFAAVELSYDVDYVRYRGSFVYASGDGDPDDGKATGFDSIFDNPNFAGGGTSFFIRQPVRLTGSGVGLKQRLSLLPNLRTSKEQGQANFVNPGLMLFNLGADIDVTPKVKLIANASYLRFVNSSSMELLLQDNQIDEEIGVDLSLGIIYRPFLNNNVIITGGAACLLPGQGFQDLYSQETLYSLFTGITLTY